MNRILRVGALLALVVFAWTPRVDAASFADVIAVVDESGSMSGEHAWLAGMIGSLDADLITAGLTPNQYGMVGFGGGTGAHPDAGHQHNVGGAQFGTAAQFATAAGLLVTSGATEDGYSGIDAALGYTQRAGTAQNIILVTDEDRDNINGALTAASILTGLQGQSTLLNVVVNAEFRCVDGSVALGIDSKGTAYKQNGSSYATCAAGAPINGFGTTIADYVTLALASGGAAWDLNQLRLGGDTAAAFTEAFVKVKVGEIRQQPAAVPEPASMLLVGSGLLGLARAHRRRSQKKA